MKTIQQFYNKGFMMMALMLSSVLTFAQEKDINVDINVDKGGDLWYKQPWVWVVGGLVFILLLVAILRGGKKD